MARNSGSCDFSDLKAFTKRLEQLQQKEIDAFIESSAKELAARLLAKVIKRTPVGQYATETGKNGGTLRRAWTNDNKDMKVVKSGDVYVIEIRNNTEYANYVEYGHRKRGGKGWVEGRFMLTISEAEVKAIAPKVLEAKLMKMLGEAFDGK